MTKDEALRLALEYVELVPDDRYNADHIDRDALITTIKTTLEAKDEPVALKMDVIVVNLVREGINKHRARELAEHFIKHTTTPPQRKPLTRQQINQMMADAGWQNSAIRQADLDKVEKVARAIEQAHGIKGEA